jgi:hypothetical protein
LSIAKDSDSWKGGRRGGKNPREAKEENYQAAKTVVHVKISIIYGNEGKKVDVKNDIIAPSQSSPLLTLGLFTNKIKLVCYYE